MLYALKNDYYELKISSKGAEIISILNADKKELLWQNPTNKDWSDHAPILFPICGNIKDKIAIYKGKAYPMTLHGFASKSEFFASEVSESKITLTLKSDDNTKAQYPFDFKLTVTYSLESDKITFGATVENTGEEILPYSFGWHPGFNLFCDKGQDIEDYSVKFDNKKEITWVNFHSNFDTPNDYIPYATKNSEYKLCEKEIYEHDTMVFRGAGNSVKLTADGYPFMLDMAWTENLPVLCLWKSENHEAKFICIEPWTHDTIRGEISNHWEARDAHRLNTGEKEYFEYTLKFKF